MAVAALAWALAGCAETEFAVHTAKVFEGGEEAAGGFKLGKPYQVDGVWYYPEYTPYYDETGIASWYGADFHGRRTANGEVYDMNAVTAAHKTLPLPSNVRVTNLENGRSIVVRVNDRGPFVHGRIIDLSRRSAQLLGLEVKGTGMVRVQILPISQQPAVLVAALRREGYALPGDEEDLRLAYNEAPPSAPVSVTPLESPSQGGGGLISSAYAAEAAPPESAPIAAPVAAPTPDAPQMFIQAGAFADAANAAKALTALRATGPAKITPVIVNDKVFYRVRLGPYDELGTADSTLEAVIHNGFPDARLIVD